MWILTIANLILVTLASQQFGPETLESAVATSQETSFERVEFIENDADVDVTLKSEWP